MTWQEELNKRIVDYILANGSPVDISVRSLYYGWQARDREALYEHLRTCPLDYTKCTFTDDEWTEFAGTFAESDNRCVGLGAAITCSCGEIAGRPWRMEFGYGEGYAEMLKEITE